MDRTVKFLESLGINKELVNTTERDGVYIVPGIFGVYLEK